ncbi:MAG: hypothetical protein ACREOD_08490 [Candidatus Dormibacteria bacterium]
MLTQPRRQRRSLPTPPATPAPGPGDQASEWRVRLAWALLAVAAAALLGDVLAVVATLGAIVHLGALRGPLEFALVLVGAVLGLVGSAAMGTGSLAVVRPDWTFAGDPRSVLWGLGLQLPAAAAVGVLQASWPFTVVYLLLLLALGYFWIRTSPLAGARPSARHVAAESDPDSSPRPASVPTRQPIPWMTSAPPPPSAPESRMPPGSPPSRSR